MAGEGRIVGQNDDEGCAVCRRAALASLKDLALRQIQQPPAEVSLHDKTVGVMRDPAERMPAFTPGGAAATRQRFR
jgi:hypothetical protein